MSAIPSWCRVGAEVVCVDANWTDEICLRAGIVPPSREPMLNEVLRIAEVVPGADHPNGHPDFCYLSFDGIPPFLYASDCFRPLVTLEDDITTYFADLLDVREPVEV